MTAEHDRDLLLAYLYGALEDDERERLETRLDKDEELRAALDRAREEQELLAEAAGVPADDLTLSPPRARLISPAFLKAAAAILVGAGLVFAGWRTHRRSVIEEGHPVLAVSGPGSFVAGTTADYEIETASLDGDGVPATVLAYVHGIGDEPQEYPVETDGDGQATFALDPAGAAPGARLNVRFALSANDGTSVAHTLPLLDGTRIATRVSTDKPLYKPGETVRIRGVALESFRLTPAGDVPLRLQLLDPQGAAIFDRPLPAKTGITGWEHALPEDAPGGSYRLILKGADDASPVAQSERTFHVRTYRIPRLLFDLELDRDSYGPGDAGRLYASIERVEGGAPKDASVQAVLRVDGQVVSDSTLALGLDGSISVPFALPAEIAEGRGQLSLTVADGGTVETQAKTVPITLGRVDVELYPEGGELVAGLPNRVYFSARNPSGEPTDLVASVQTGAGATVAQARVDVRGMGLFELTPEAGETYHLVAESPAAVTVQHEFPVVQPGGVVLRSDEESNAAGGALRLSVGATEPGTYTVSAWCRGGQLAQRRVDLHGRGLTPVELRPVSGVGGVVRVTVSDARGLPRAERLISRVPARRLNVAIHPERARYAPREHVKIDLTVTDENGGPAAAILGASVVDDGVLSLANDEDTASLPLHFLLGMEVEELERAELYADAPESAHSVDLLLGVQGWRRFAWHDVRTFLAEHPETGPRLGLVAGSQVTHTRDNGDSARNGVDRAMRRIDEKAVGISIAAGIALVFLGGIVIGIRALWQRRGWAAFASLGAAGVVGMFVLAAIVMHGSLGAQAPGAVARAVGDAAGAENWLEFEAGAAAAQPDAPAELMEGKFEVSPEEVERIREEAAALGEGRGRLAKLRRELAEVMKNPQKPGAGLAFEADADFEVLDDLIADKKFRAFRVLLREYTHVAAAPTGVRDDFTEVLYWHPLLITDEQGKASLEFDTSDAVTTFRVAIEGHDGRGALGASDVTFESRVPFYVEPKFPVQLSAGDQLDLPVVVANDAASAAAVRVAYSLSSALLVARGAQESDVEVAAEARGRVIFPLLADQGRGVVRLEISGESDAGLRDTTSRSISVVPRGYPMTVAKSGILEKVDGATIVLPDDLNAFTLKGSLKLYPSTLSTLVDGLEGMLQEPYGCFEQASSTNYPNVLVLRYLQEQDAAAPAVARRARELLASGYDRLSGYECRERGYEWFGGDPGHEALTAYGLMEFVDMQAVHDVDAGMVQRTRDWLLSRRDGDGGFQRNARALDSFGNAPQEITDAYIVWALTESDDALDLTPEFERLKKRARASDDAYLVALAANALLNRRDEAAKAVLEQLVKMQKDDGSLTGTSTSITSSSGPNLTIETTALAALAFTKSPPHAARAASAVQFLLTQRQNGRFGATQATILALRALIDHAKANRKTSTSHDIEVWANGAQVASRHVAAGEAGVILFDHEVLAALRPGPNEVEIRTNGAETLPWALTLAYHTQLPPSNPECKVAVTTELDTGHCTEGDTVGLQVTLRNLSDEGVPMTLARVGLPAGLEPRAEQLNELRKAGTFDFYETRPREITIYYRGLAGGAEKTIKLDLVAAIPGRFEGPATSSYLYYGDDLKNWAAPMRIQIDAR